MAKKKTTLEPSNGKQLTMEIEELESQFHKMFDDYEGSYTKMDTLSAGILNGRYDVSGFGLYPANTLQQLLSGGSATIAALRSIARSCSVVRYCVDTMCREIQSTPWEVRSTNNKKAPRNKTQQIIDFFMEPELDQDDYTFNAFMSKNTRDLLEIDWNLIEKERSDSKKLIELVPLDAGSYQKIAKKNGRLDFYVPNDMSMKYDESGANIESSKHKIYPPDAISKSMYPRTGTLYGTPIIQSIIEEIGAIVYSTIHVRKFFTDGQIPEGVLNAGRMSPKDRDRFETKLTESRGQPWLLKILYGAEALEWVEFKRSHSDQQLSELRQHIERIIYRSFGFNTLDMGEEVSKGGAKEQRNVSRNRLIHPILDIYKMSFDRVVHKEFNAPDLEFRWALEKMEELESIGRAHDRMIRSGQETVNEARQATGRDPVDGGDIPFVVIGNQAVPIKLIEKLIETNMKNQTRASENQAQNQNQDENNNSDEKPKDEDDDDSSDKKEYEDE